MFPTLAWESERIEGTMNFSSEEEIDILVWVAEGKDELPGRGSSETIFLAIESWWAELEPKIK